MTSRKIDRQGMARAVADFLSAAGLDPASELLSETSRLTADAWADEFLSGCSSDPMEPLSKKNLCISSSLCCGDCGLTPVALRSISYVSVCPHHLLPYEGLAHIAYIPSAEGIIAGFGSFVQVLDILSHRLILQEVLASELCKAIASSDLNPRYVFVRLEARQNCLALRGERRNESLAVCEALTPNTPPDVSLLLRKALFP